MKKLSQIAVLIVGLAGLSACASTAASSYSDDLSACQERVARLEAMNKTCYRK